MGGSVVKKILGLFIIGCLIGVSAPALADQTKIRVDHADVRLLADYDALRPDELHYLAIEVMPDSGWHSYWFNPGDSGLAPTANWQVPPGLTVGQLILPTPVRLKAGDFVNYGFSGQMVAVTPVRVASGNLTEVPISVDFNFLVCEEICIPHQVNLSITLPVRPDAQPVDPDFFSAVQNQWPKKWQGDVGWSKQDDKIQLVFDNKKPPIDRNTKDLWFFTKQPGISLNQGNVDVLDDGLRLGLRLPVGDVAPENDRIEGVLAWRDAQGYHGYEISAPLKPLTATPPAEMGWFLAVILAFLGGALLNFMPCVFPVLALKIMAFVRHHGDRRQLWRENFGYASGIVACFLLLGGVMITLRQLGTAIGWGFQLQEPLVIWGLLVLFVIIGGALAFDLSLNSVGIEDKNPPRQPGWGRGFATGLLVAVVASPCTAPMMAAALGAALVLPVWQGGLIFAALGLGLAVPMMMVTLIPGLARYCPRPGPWMDRLRQGLAFPMFGAAAWLLWVLGGQVDRLAQGWIFVLVMAVVFALWLAAIMPRWRLAWLVVAIGVAVSGGVMLSKPTINSDWQSYHPDKVAAALASGQSVFVDATADWCITCLVNERTALADSVVKQTMATQKILLLKADWTRRDPVVTKLLEQHGRAGVPLYVWYQPGRPPQILPQILTPSLVLKALKNSD
jgi:thiol:disulfide interchange protein DsbD